MADTLTTFSTISTDAPNVWISERMYTLTERRLQIGQWAQKYTLPQRMSKTMRVVRYRRLALPRATLTEGFAPDAVALAVDNVDVTVEQWGIVVLITDVGLITTKHPALTVAIQRTALAMAEVLEREMCSMLLGGTNIYYGGTANVARADLAAGDNLNTSLILNSTTFLRAKGAADWETGLFGGVMAPQGEAEVLKSDMTFQNASNYANVKVLQYAEIGVWQGVRWTRGNFLPIFRGEVAPDGDAATTVKAQLTAGAAGALATANYQVVTVAREVNSYYERRISQNSANIAVTGPTGSISVALPTSANYVYDIYMTSAGGTAPRLVIAAQANSTTYVITAVPGATAAAPPAAPVAGVEVFVAWVFGQDGFGRVELSGMSLQSYITPPGASYSNPIAQGRKVGSKVMWKSFIQDNDFFVRLEHTSSFSAFLAA